MEYLKDFDDLVEFMRDKGYKLVEDGKKGYLFNKQQGTQKHNCSQIFFKTTEEMFALMNNKEFRGSI